MSSTVAADFVFQPKVWKDHIEAYFRKKLVFGALAVVDRTLMQQPGTTINFPFFKSIGAVEEPAETASLAVDNLSDDSFSATVKEVGKAVGVKKKAFKVSAASTDKIIEEITNQLGRVHAEKIDADLIAEVAGAGNFQVGYTGAVAADVMDIRKVLKAKVTAFGDKHDESIAIQMHSRQFADLMVDNTAGFLKADATDPMYGMAGFSGRLLGMALFVTDQVPQVTDIGGLNAFEAFIHKVNPYGIMMKQEMELEADYDLLAREWIFTSNQWYAVKSFHGKISSVDFRTAKMTTPATV